MEDQNLLPIDGLLHLGALAVVITTGYLGIDKVYSERGNFYRTLDDLSEEIRSVLEAEKDAVSISLPKLMKTSTVYTLCYVARLKVKDRGVFSYITGFFVNSWYVPFLGYFRSKIDRYITGAAAIVSLISFLWLVHNSMLPQDDGWCRTLEIDLYWLYASVVSWVFLTAAIAATRLRSIRSTCGTLHSALQQATSELAKSSFADSTKGLKALQPDD